MPSKRKRAQYRKQQQQQARERRQVEERDIAKYGKRYDLNHKRVAQSRANIKSNVRTLTADANKHTLIKQQFINAETVLEIEGYTIQIGRLAHELRLNTNDVIQWFRKSSGINRATRQLRYNMKWAKFCEHFKIELIEVVAVIIKMSPLLAMIKESQK